MNLLVIAKDAADIEMFKKKSNLEGVENFIGWDNSRNPPLGCLGYGQIANKYLDWLRKEHREEILGIVHADVTLGKNAVRDIRDTLDRYPRSVCGIVGRAESGGEGGYIWGKDVATVDSPVDVSILDGSSLFIRGDTFTSAWFDTAVFDGLHCCVEDFCLNLAINFNARILVPAVAAQHVGVSTRDPAWQLDYGKYRAMLQQKYRRHKFVTT